MGLLPPALELLASYSVNKRILCVYTHTQHTHTHTHTQRERQTHTYTHTHTHTHNPPTHYTIHTCSCRHQHCSVSAFRASSVQHPPRQARTHAHTHTHTNINITIVCLYSVYSHTCTLSQIHTSIHVK